MVIESEGIKIVFESDFEEYLKGTVIDYSDSWYRRGFTIRGGSMSTC
jgi:Fe-S cluster assembly iron-binding protein IscA